MGGVKSVIFAGGGQIKNKKQEDGYKIAIRRAILGEIIKRKQERYVTVRRLTAALNASLGAEELPHTPHSIGHHVANMGLRKAGRVHEGQKWAWTEKLLEELSLQYFEAAVKKDTTEPVPG